MVRRLTMARVRGARVQQDSTEETGSGSARHQPRAVLGNQQDGAIGGGVLRQWWRSRRHASLRHKQRQHLRVGSAPSHRCPVHNTLPMPRLPPEPHLPLKSKSQRQTKQWRTL